MSNFGDKVQPAVKKETKNVAIYTVVGVVVMWVGFLILLTTLSQRFLFYLFKIIILLSFLVKHYL